MVNKLTELKKKKGVFATSQVKKKTKSEKLLVKIRGLHFLRVYSQKEQHSVNIVFSKNNINIFQTVTLNEKVLSVSLDRGGHLTISDKTNFLDCL